MNSFVRFVAILAGLGCFVAGPNASAASPVGKHYFGVSYYQQDIEFVTDAGTVSSSPDGFMAKYGYLLMRHVAVEVHGGMSTKKVDDATDDSVINDYLFSAFARGELPLSAQNVTLYALAGVSRAKATYTDDTGTSSTAYSKATAGLAYGIGAELFGTPTTSFHVEWMKYMTADHLTSSGLSLGITHHFSLPKLW